ncbi:FUT6 fucosyltransferase, partial [Furnarius figulus]|nr:FUT6 fucosyltransferase [Furnarius figulus]
VLFPGAPMEPMEGRKFSFRKLLNLLLLSLIFSSFLFVSLHRSRLWDPERPHSNASPGPPPRAGNATLTILLWTWPFGSQLDSLACPELPEPLGCLFTANLSAWRGAAALVVHHRDACGAPERLARLPRLPTQRWLWLNMESPSHSPNLSAMNNLFNLTVSYRHDSDIFLPYGELRPLRQPRPLAVPRKSRLVAWVVSNWREESRRVSYYRELRKHIVVDVYGKEHAPLPREQLLPTVSRYCFYLAFENSQHEDYITEKLWRNALAAGTVPVVLGPPRHNYERFLPPDSFIHVDDFGSAAELARFLWQLGWDPQRYRGYLQWRRWFRPVVGTGWARRLCRVCHFLRSTPARYHTVPDLATWFV